MATSKFDIWCREYGLEIIRKLAEEGLSDEEIARRAGIDELDYYGWLKRYPKFRDAVKIGRSEADFSVVEAVYKKATGYNVSVNKTHKLKRVDYDPDTGRKLREYEELAVAADEDYIPPDLRAGIFWLKNRQPDRWNEKGIGSDALEGGIIEIPTADSIDALPDAGKETAGGEYAGGKA